MKKTLIVLGLVIFIACNKSDITIPFSGFIKPSHFPEVNYDFSKNPITQEGFNLGKQLFYDPILSRDNSISCASCHIQSSAFTQHGHDVSHGIEDRLGKRNSMPIMNLAWSKSFMWDGGIFHLDLQPFAPISAHEEMDENVANVIAKIQATNHYPYLFEKAFGSRNITTNNFMKALSQFMLMCVSSNAKYDSVTQHLGNAQFSVIEQRGYQIFQQHCNRCHQEPLFTNNTFANNGIGVGYNNDLGRYDVTLNSSDRYLFKVPSLRNLTYTAPYMHDGRYYNIAAVIEHYRSEINSVENLDKELPIGGFKFSVDDKEALIQFLKTLDDPTFIKNKILSE